MKERQAGLNMLKGVAYGDAAGLPVEKKTRIEIAELFAGGIDRLMPVITNPFFQGDYPPGTWSDDTQLSLAITEALMEYGAYDLRTVADHHVLAYSDSALGWGRSTTRSMTRLVDGISPEKSGEPTGEGNGVLMKMAPLIYWQTLTGIGDRDRRQQLEALTRMTHDSDLAAVCTLVHAEVLATLLRSSPAFADPSALLPIARTAAASFERKYQTTNELSNMLAELGRARRLTPEKILEISDGAGFHAPDTLVMAYGAFIIQPRFPDSVFTAVNLGGDTDSIGSIVGAMSAMYYGELNLPDDYDKIKDPLRIEKAGRGLTKLVLGA